MLKKDGPLSCADVGIGCACAERMLFFPGSEFVEGEGQLFHLHLVMLDVLGHHFQI